MRALNSSNGDTIILTTQYHEEADALADRVGIIAGGRIEADGTPDELKRSVGTALIVVTVDGDDGAVERAADVLRDVQGVERVDIHGRELSVSSPNGSEAIAGVAVARDRCDVDIASLTLRTPTLDDVFLDVTGNKLSGDTSSTGTTGTTDGSQP